MPCSDVARLSLKPRRGEHIQYLRYRGSGLTGTRRARAERASPTVLLSPSRSATPAFLPPTRPKGAREKEKESRERSSGQGTTERVRSGVVGRDREAHTHGRHAQAGGSESKGTGEDQTERE